MDTAVMRARSCFNIVVLIVQSVWRYEISVQSAYAFCPGVHHLGKLIGPFAYMYHRYCHRRIVARRKHKAIKKILQALSFLIIEVYTGALCAAGVVSIS